MLVRSVLLLSGLALAAGFGCYQGPTLEPNRVSTPSDPTEATDPTEPAPTGKPPLSAATDVPCDVATLLSDACTSCHGTEPTGGAPNALVSYDDLAAASESNPSKSVAEVSLERMKSAKRPMPPTGLLGADRVGVLERWIAAGLPKGSCDDSAGKGKKDSGTGTGTGTRPDAGGGPPPVSGSVCTSGASWSSSGAQDATMAPGEACIACHKQNGAKSFAIMGTVFPSLHEPDDCNGMPGGATVIVTDANNVQHSMTVNAVGNFTRVTAIPMPYTAKVVIGTRVREMIASQTNGDCNACHTASGTSSAPGRILVP